MRILLPLLLLHLAALPAGAADVRFLAIGDSNTVGHGDNGVRCPDPTKTGGYPPRLRTRLAAQGIDAEFVNRGVCGESTTTGLTRIDSVLAEGGDVIVIMQGTIDIGQRLSLETTLFDLREMARKAEDAGIEPLLASVIPRGPESHTDTSNFKTQSLAVQLAAIAAFEGWAFADPFHAFFDIPDWFELYYFDQVHPGPAGYGIMADSMVLAAISAATRSDLCRQVPAGACTPSATVLCLNQGRFRLEIGWENFEGGSGMGQAIPQTDDTGAFYWVDSQNVEMAVKVLDGRSYNGYFWVFYGALTNFELTLIVTDTETRECREYFNPKGTFASVGDTEAFREDPP